MITKRKQQQQSRAPQIVVHATETVARKKLIHQVTSALITSKKRTTRQLLEQQQQPPQQHTAKRQKKQHQMTDNQNNSVSASSAFHSLSTHNRFDNLVTASDSEGEPDGARVPVAAPSGSQHHLPQAAIPIPAIAPPADSNLTLWVTDPNKPATSIEHELTLIAQQSTTSPAGAYLSTPLSSSVSSSSVPSSSYHHSLFQPGSQSDDMLIELIDDFSKLSSALHQIRQHKLLSVDCEGVSLGRYGELCLIQVAVRGEKKSPVFPPCYRHHVYLFDVVRLGRQLFDYGLRDILQNPHIHKLFFDCRRDSQALYHQFNCHVRGIIDCQLVEIASRSRRGYQANRLPGFSRVLAYHFPYIHPTLQQIKQTMNARYKESPTLWRERPLHSELIYYAAADVAYLAVYYEKVKYNFINKPATVWTPKIQNGITSITSSSSTSTNTRNSASTTGTNSRSSSSGSSSTTPTKWVPKIIQNGAHSSGSGSGGASGSPGSPSSDNNSSSNGSGETAATSNPATVSPGWVLFNVLGYTELIAMLRCYGDRVWSRMFWLDVDDGCTETGEHTEEEKERACAVPTQDSIFAEYEKQRREEHLATSTSSSDVG